MRRIGVLEGLTIYQDEDESGKFYIERGKDPMVVSRVDEYSSQHRKMKIEFFLNEIECMVDAGVDLLEELMPHDEFGGINSICNALNDAQCLHRDVLSWLKVEDFDVRGINDVEIRLDEITKKIEGIYHNRMLKKIEKGEWECQCPSCQSNLLKEQK